jgi:hypothetical protein
MVTPLIQVTVETDFLHCALVILLLDYSKDFITKVARKLSVSRSNAHIVMVLDICCT